MGLCHLWLLGTSILSYQFLSGEASLGTGRGAGTGDGVWAGPSGLRRTHRILTITLQWG